MRIPPTPALIMMVVPLYAIAAEATTRNMGDGPRFWWTLLAVQILALAGYAASSLADWAGWPDGSLSTKLTIVKGAATSFLAANIGFYGAAYYFSLAEVVCFITAAVAAWGGDKFLTPILSKITGKVGEVK